MAVLCRAVERTLTDIKRALDGEVTLSESLEELIWSLAVERVPEAWLQLSWPSERPLGSWVDNLVERTDHLEEFRQSTEQLPRVIRLNGLFCPEAFLSSIIQVCSQEKKVALNDLSLRTEVTK